MMEIHSIDTATPEQGALGGARSRQSAYADRLTAIGNSTSDCLAFITTNWAIGWAIFRYPRRKKDYVVAIHRVLQQNFH